jgi:Na+-transporting NADH:ubiquinone oxidoreductase subunit C
MPDGLKSILFAVGLCLACSVLLTAASSGLQPLQERNVLIDRHRNILKAASVLQEDGDDSARRVEELYSARIRPLGVDSTGRILSDRQAGQEPSLPIYLVVDGQALQGYIIPIDTKGLWGPIRAYLALDTDGSTVKGFTVVQHAETPGLGGEIEKRWFRENWVGKKIVSRDGRFVSVGVAKGSVQDAVPREKQVHYVDGISGATLTGKYLAAGVKDTLSRYEPVSVKFRKNLIRDLDGIPPAQ